MNRASAINCQRGTIIDLMVSVSLLAFFLIAPLNIISAQQPGAAPGQTTNPPQATPPSQSPAPPTASPDKPTSTTPGTTPAPSTVPSTISPGTLGTPTVPLSPAQSSVPPLPAIDSQVVRLSPEEAVQLALKQASTFRQAQLSEQIAAEDVRQARTAFLPRLSVPSTFVYNSRASGANLSTTPSFIGANAITEYQVLAGVTGELDTSGRLRATLKRNQELLIAARAGTSLARRALIVATEGAYYTLAFATARRVAAGQNLANAEEFERVTALLLKGGEVAPVDVIRARLQTTQRQNELELARSDEAAAADSLRVLVGFDFNAPIAVRDLLMMLPAPGELDRFNAAGMAGRPELLQFEAQRRAAEQEIKLARADRRPQLIYSINGGFDSDSLRPKPLRSHTGAIANVGFAVPLFDWGASRSRAAQAALRVQTAQSSLEQARRTLAQDFSTASKQAQLAISRIRIAQRGVVDAESNINASLARYRAGEAQIIEVTDAQNALVTQRATLYQALFDYQTARSRLAQAAGK